MLCNIDVAILTRLNDLAERLGLRPYDFVATFQTTDHGDILQFESSPEGNALREERWAKMLSMLNVNENGERRGDWRNSGQAIDDAIAQLPKPQRRF
jgi:hypothetical protein